MLSGLSVKCCAQARKEEEARKTKPTAASIFGAARPVDTAQRYKNVVRRMFLSGSIADSARI